MQYFHFAIVVCFGIGALWLSWRYFRRLKQDYLRRILEKMLSESRNKLPTDPPYSTEAVLAAAEYAAGAPRALQNEFVRLCLQKKISPLIRLLETQGQKNTARCFSVMTGKRVRMPPYIGTKAQKAALFLAEAKKHLNEGDLLSATEKSSAAAQIFNRLNFIYEEAEAYLLLGTVYRVSAVFDVADFMLRTARKIFCLLGARGKEAECLGTLGMLTATQKRFDEAFDFFDQAEDIYARIGRKTGEADIVNQKALTRLLQGDMTTALKEVVRALHQHRAQQNLRGEAFALEIRAYINRAEKNWTAVRQNARQAAKLHDKLQNLPATLEMRFLQAEALFAREMLEQAEKLLREIIAADKKQRSCFQVANSYNLLGLIYLLRHDLKRARALFAQSLACEIQNDRSLGALIDYANMANIESKSGHFAQAQKYLQLAINQARSLDEKELQNLLEKRLIQNEAAATRREKNPPEAKQR